MACISRSIRREADRARMVEVLGWWRDIMPPKRPADDRLQPERASAAARRRRRAASPTRASRMGAVGRSQVAGAGTPVWTPVSLPGSMAVAADFATHPSGAPGAGDEKDATTAETRSQASAHGQMKLRTESSGSFASISSLASFRIVPRLGMFAEARLKRLFEIEKRAQFAELQLLIEWDRSDLVRLVSSRVTYYILCVLLVSGSECA